MKQFKQYITEAKVSAGNLNKVAEIFKRIVEKQLSTRLFRFAGPKGFCEIKGGMGILYFYDRRKAMRLNYIKGEIQSITLWKSFKLGQKGDYTIDLGGLGLLAAGKELIRILKNPSPGKIKTYGELVEGVLLEAKRISPIDFYELVQNNLPGNESIESLSWGIISDIALSNDVQIPTAVRFETKVPGTKGRNSRFNLRALVTDVRDPDKKSRDVEPTYYIKITSQDPVSKKFLSVKGDKRAEDMLKTMGNAIEKPDYKKEAEHPDSLFGRMANLVRVICRGTRNALVIYGGPGIGKTWVVTNTIKEEGLSKGKDWYVVKGKITTTTLYQTLFMHRKGGLLVFDDTDSLWSDKDAANILKAALDSYEERTISWMSNRTINVSKMSEEDREELNDTIDDRMENDPEGNTKLPSEFNYDGRIIFISNLTKDKFDEAVLNRSAKIDMTLTEDQIFIRMRSILQHLGEKSVPYDIKEEILDYIQRESKSGKMDGVSMRTYVAAEDLYRSGIEDWKDMMGNM